jgi:hypothetical protein
MIPATHIGYRMAGRHLIPIFQARTDSTGAHGPGISVAPDSRPNPFTPVRTT